MKGAKWVWVLKYLSVKTELSLALSTAKRVSNLSASSLLPSCMTFSADRWRVTLLTNSAYQPEHIEARSVLVDLIAFCPPPLASGGRSTYTYCAWSVCPWCIWREHTHCPI